MFAHPTTREKITREDCIRLDNHLQSCGRRTSTSTVTEAYDLLHHSAAVNAKKREQTEAMRREATVLFQHLFTFRSRRQPSRQPSSKRKAHGARPAAGLTIVDDDEEFFSRGTLETTQFDFERDFPELFPVLHHQHQSSSGSETLGQGSHGRLVKPVPRGGARISSRMVSEDTGGGEVMMDFGHVPMPVTSSDVALEPNPNDSEEEEEEEVPLFVQPVIDYTAEQENNEEEEARKKEFESQLRRQQQQKQSHGASTSSVHRRKPLPPPPPKTHQVFANGPTLPSSAEVSVQSPVSDVSQVTQVEPAVTERHSTIRRRFVDGKTFKGPCATSLLVTLGLVGILLLILFLSVD